MEDPKVPIGANMEALIEDGGGEHTALQQGVAGSLASGKLNGVGMLSGVTGETTMMESFCKQCELPTIAGEVSTKWSSHLVR